MAVSEARDHLAELIDATRRSGDPVFVTRRGCRVAVILRVGDYRVVYEIHDARLLIQVVRVGHRRQVCR